MAVNIYPFFSKAPFVKLEVCSFGKKEKAEEDQYFRRQEREQLEKMKKLEAEEKAKKKQEGKK